MIYKKYILIILIILILFFSFSGFRDVENVDDLAYVVALGIDVGDNETLKLSLQIPASNKSESSSQGGGSSSKGSDTITETIDCPSIDSGLNLVNSYISKEINLSHCKAIIISEEVAFKGISKYIYTLVNKIDIRPDTNLIITRCTAKDFLNNSNPVLESLSSKYYEIAPKSSEYTGYTDNVTINDFYSSLNDTFKEPYAILGGLNSSSLEPHYTKNVPNDSNLPNDNNTKASETPIETSINIENMGLAVFKGDTLVGELSGIETISHLLLSNKMQYCIVSVPSPFKDNSNIDLDLTMQKNSKINVKIVNGTPYIDCHLYLHARILSMQGGTEHLGDKNLKEIEELASSYIKQQILNYLYKTSKEFESDTVGFGKYAVSEFLTWEDWTNYNWLNNYRDSFFNVDVDVNVASGYLLVES